MRTFSNNPGSKYWINEWFLRESSEIEVSINKDQENHGYELLQGKGIAQGALVGGCNESLDVLRGTELWPNNEFWNEKILFLEPSLECPSPEKARASDFI